MIKVSIILPSYNVAKYIKECFESVINQTLRDIEIICVDCCSTDGTRDIIEKYKSIDSRIRVINSNIKSYGHQVNLGIKEANGLYIGVVETDDFIDKKMYESLYEYAVKLNADVVKSPYIEYYNDRHKEICYYADYLNKKLPLNKCFSSKEHGELLAFHASIWSGLYKKSYLIDNDIFFCEPSGAGYVDVGFRVDTLINTDKIAWFNESGYYYRVNSYGSSTNRFNILEMALRWNEIHKKLEEKKEDYDQYYGKYMIFDEYLNTVAWIGNAEVTEKDLKVIIENLNYTDLQIILDSEVLPHYAKKELVAFKEDPNSYFEKKNRFISIKLPIMNIGKKIFPKGSRARIIIKKLFLLHS